MKATERLARHGIAFEKHDGRLVIRHIILVAVTRGERVERYDRCVPPSGPHPMHEGCPWMAAKTQGAMV